MYWAEQGIRIFRVDNPHTKPFAFWEWLIGEVQAEYPEAIFSVGGFHAAEGDVSAGEAGFHAVLHVFCLEKYQCGDHANISRNLTQPPVREFFRLNLWPNTPDILNEYLQNERPRWVYDTAFLAATLGRVTEFMGRLSSCVRAERWPRAARSIWIRRNIRFASGTSIDPTACAT